jgi:hypothetical protein
MVESRLAPLDGVKVTHLPGEHRVRCVTMPGDTCIIRQGDQSIFTHQCQNLPKAREGSLKKIFKGSIPMVRSVVTAPEGHCLIEVDYESAEFWTLAYLANDAAMKKALHTTGSDGKRLSLHTVNAVNIFNLSVTPVEFEAIRTNKSHKDAALYGQLRVAAKSVGFGSSCSKSC